MWGSEPLVWGSEQLVWGSEVNFASKGVWRSEMWGSWPPSPSTLGGLEGGVLAQGSISVFILFRVCLTT